MIAHAQRFGKAAGLVELDIDRVIAADERGEVLGRVHAFIRTDGYRAGNRRQRIVAPGGQRLLDQVDPFLGADCEVIGEGFGRPPLIGIEDDAALGRARPHGADTRAIVRCADLDLEECAVGIFRRLFAHGVWLGE